MQGSNTRTTARQLHHVLTTVPSAARSSHGRAIRRTTLAASGAFGILVAGFLALAAIDILAFDRTSGGTAPHYEDFSGTPLNFDAMTLTETGFVKDGRVLDAHLNCTTGMISFKPLIGPKFDYRTVSERAIHVHQPREACKRQGFSPQF